MTSPAQKYTAQEILDAIKVHEMIGIDPLAAMTDEQFLAWSRQQYAEHKLLIDLPDNRGFSARKVYQEHILPALYDVVIATALEQKAPFMESGLANCTARLSNALANLYGQYAHFNDENKALAKGFADKYGTEAKTVEENAAFLNEMADEIAEKIANKMRVLDLEAVRSQARG